MFERRSYTDEPLRPERPFLKLLVVGGPYRKTELTVGESGAAIGSSVACELCLKQVGTKATHPTCLRLSIEFCVQIGAYHRHRPAPRPMAGFVRFGIAREDRLPRECVALARLRQRQRHLPADRGCGPRRRRGRHLPHREERGAAARCARRWRAAKPLAALWRAASTVILSIVHRRPTELRYCVSANGAQQHSCTHGTTWYMSNSVRRSIAYTMYTTARSGLTSFIRLRPRFARSWTPSP